MVESRVQKIPTAASRPKEELRVSDINITDEFMIIDEKANGSMVSDMLLKIPGGGVVLVKKHGTENDIIGVISIRDILVYLAQGHNVASMESSG